MLSACRRFGSSKPNPAVIPGREQGEPGGLGLVNIIDNIIDRHTRQPVRPLAGRMTGSSGYPVRRGFAILSLALWNTWVARSSRAMTLCARVLICPSGSLSYGGQVASRNDVGEHRRSYGVTGGQEVS